MMTQKVNSGMKRLIRNLKSFSLVELIIVIAIIAILSVSAVMILTKWIGESRDSKRLSDLETIEKSLTVNYMDQDTAEQYPMPDENNDGSGITSGEIGGENVAYKGTFGSGAIEEVDSLNKVPVDPLDDDRYAYGVTEDQQYFQIAAVLEDGEKVSYRLMNRAYAVDKKSVVRGNYDGLMVYISGGSNYISNIPSLIFNNTGSLTNTGEVSYVVDGSSNLAYGDTTQKESFEEVLRKTYGLSGDASVSFVNTGTDSLKKAIEDGNLSESMKNSLGGNEGVIESKLEESGVSVESSDDGGGGIDIPEGECKDGLCVFNLSDSNKTSTDKKLMTYQPRNVDLPGLPTNTTSEGVPTELEWGCYGISTSATSNTDGGGNTQTIVSNNCTVDGSTNSGPDYIAADYCENIELGGYNDWYLPARYEFDAMCERDSYNNGADCSDTNANDMSIGGEIGSSRMWSSTESNSNYARILSSPGSWNRNYKYHARAVQCVRSVDQ